MTVTDPTTPTAVATRTWSEPSVPHRRRRLRARFAAASPASRTPRRRGGKRWPQGQAL